MDPLTVENDSEHLRSSEIRRKQKSNSTINNFRTFFFTRLGLSEDGKLDKMLSLTGEHGCKSNSLKLTIADYYYLLCR